MLSRLGFRCEPAGPTASDKGGSPRLRVTPPSWRATKDIEIEADLIEEIARFIGYNNIEPSQPRVAARYFEPSPELDVERRTLEYLCVGGDFCEVHDYIWYDDDWCKTLGFAPGECITLKNPAADNCARLRTSLVPGLLAIAERNRHHIPRFQLAEIGSVFYPGRSEVEQSQHRNLALCVAESGRKADQAVWDRLRSALEGWARQVLESGIEFGVAKSAKPWEDADRMAEVRVDGKPVGRATILPLALKQRIDERLKAWSIALAEVNLSAVAPLIHRHATLAPVPRFPQVQLDFSVLADAAERYESLRGRLAAFTHPQLKRLTYVEAYQGGSIPSGKRSLTFRAEIGLPDRTLNEDEIRGFQDSFKGYLTSCGLQLRGQQT
jgi:phenylalanyl-tRNA synthetase beta chain